MISDWLLKTKSLAELPLSHSAGGGWRYLGTLQEERWWVRRQRGQAEQNQAGHRSQVEMTFLDWAEAPFQMSHSHAVVWRWRLQALTNVERRLIWLSNTFDRREWSIPFEAAPGCTLPLWRIVVHWGFRILHIYVGFGWSMLKFCSFYISLTYSGGFWVLFSLSLAQVSLAIFKAFSTYTCVSLLFLVASIGFFLLQLHDFLR